MTLTYGSLFAGAGGFDMGFEHSGWECQWQVENDEVCSSILQKHWPHVSRYGDIAEVSGQEIAPVDAILFGFPCQDVSHAQFAYRRQGLAGERSSLFFEAIRVIQEMRDATHNAYPRYAVAENVVGLLSTESGRSFLRVLQTLVELGTMAIEWRVLDAQNFGLPQRRRRVFLVANFNDGADRGGTIFPQPKSLSRHDATNAKPPRAISPEDAASNESYHIFNRVGDYRYIEDLVASPVLASNFGRFSTYVMPKSGELSLRRLTPLESERLQGWPDAHTASSYDGTPISDKQRYKMIGNGIAVPCAAWVAKRIAQYDNTLPDLVL